MKMKAAVIILNWNGERLLQEFLPSVIANTNPRLASIVVADNASTDGSVALLRERFPEVELLLLDENYGFAGGYNRAIAAREEEVVVLLNSDVEVAAGWLEPLLAALEADRRLVAVQPKIRSYRDKTSFEYAGACGGFIDYLGFPFCRGRVLGVIERDEGQYDDVREVFWCSGAALCIRREDYLAAGGLDERFFAHMEEIDLCWRIRNRGGILKVCPQSVVYHLGGASLPMNHPRKLFLNYRNNLLMLYKNLSPKAWRRVAWRRCMLDWAAAVLFLLKGERKNVVAVFQARHEFARMKKFYRQPSATPHDACIYPHSLVFRYYFRRLRIFSRLWE